jgi:DNA modification methylase
MNVLPCWRQEIRKRPMIHSATLWISSPVETSFLHPTVQSVLALLPLVETFSASGGPVLDPLSGSGSRLHAAKCVGSNDLGVELDRNDHALAVDRLKVVS